MILALSNPRNLPYNLGYRMQIKKSLLTKYNRPVRQYWHVLIHFRLAEGYRIDRLPEWYDLEDFESD